MKKKTFIFSLVVVFALVIMLSFDFLLGKFFLLSYFDRVEAFKISHVAMVNDDNILEYAKFCLSQKYAYDEIYIKEYTVKYFPIIQVWEVRGVLPENMLGGVPVIYIRSNGKVITYWHSR